MLAEPCALNECFDCACEHLKDNSRHTCSLHSCGSLHRLHPLASVTASLVVKVEFMTLLLSRVSVLSHVVLLQQYFSALKGTFSTY